MAASPLNIGEATPLPRRRKTSARLATAEDHAVPTPVLQWQEALHEQWALEERRAAEPPKWSKRRTLTFVMLSCAAFWSLIILGVARLAH